MDTPAFLSAAPHSPGPVLGTVLQWRSDTGDSNGVWEMGEPRGRQNGAGGLRWSAGCQERLTFKLRQEECVGDGVKQCSSSGNIVKFPSKGEAGKDMKKSDTVRAERRGDRRLGGRGGTGQARPRRPASGEGRGPERGGSRADLGFRKAPGRARRAERAGPGGSGAEVAALKQSSVGRRSALCRDTRRGQGRSLEPQSAEAGTKGLAKE